MLKLRFLLITIFSFSVVILWSQEDLMIDEDWAEADSTQIEEFLDYTEVIELNAAEIYSLKLETDLEKKYYLWLRKRVRDVWPYVTKAVKEYNFINDTINYIQNKKERKKYIKNRQKELADRFEEDFKKMSRTRGQIMIKLIHRETGKTTYEIIKELRGGANAFLWNSAGGAFDLNLKEKFSPALTREDLYIEVILKRDFSRGILEPIEY